MMISRLACYPIGCFILAMLCAIESLEATIFDDFECLSVRYIANGTAQGCLCFTGQDAAFDDTCAKWIPTAATGYTVMDIRCEANPGKQCNYNPGQNSCGKVWNCPYKACLDNANAEQFRAYAAKWMECSVEGG